MKYTISTLIITLLLFASVMGQDSTLVLSTSMFNEDQKITLADTGAWIFRQGHDSTWAKPNLDVSSWQHLRPTEMAAKYADKSGRLEGWFRMRIKLDSSFIQFPLLIIQRGELASDIYINGKLVQSFGSTGYQGSPYAAFISFEKMPPGISLQTETELLVAVHVVDYLTSKGKLKRGRFTKDGFVSFVGPKYSELINQANISKKDQRHKFVIIVTILGVFTLLFWFFAFLNNSEGLLFIIAATVTCFFGVALFNHLRNSGVLGNEDNWMWRLAPTFLSSGLALLPLLIARVFKNEIPKFLKMYFVVCFLSVPVSTFFDIRIFLVVGGIATPLISFAVCGYYLITYRKALAGARWAIVAGLLATLLMSLSILLSRWFSISGENDLLVYSAFLSLPIGLIFYVGLWLKEINKEVRTQAAEVVKVVEEKKELLASQNLVLEHQVNERTAQLSQSLDNLKSTQAQLIQSEKMASLGELTAGIAHEIQNPLNFVNNFAEVNTELNAELQEAINSGNLRDAEEIAESLLQNEQKILHHGKRADAIVKGMLQHSRTGSGTKEPTNINALADEYLRLAYHGLKAKDNTFNASFKTDFDESIGNVDIIPQDIGRVLLNLINNAFYAVDEKKKQVGDGFEPMVTVSTRLSTDQKNQPMSQLSNSIIVSVQDNGNGISETNRNKIFQPFFTTKPTGQGTGLGLSLSYDIIKAHGGEIRVESKEGEGTVFTIAIPRA